MQTNYEQQLRAMRDGHNAQIDAMREKHDSFFHSTNEKHEALITAMRNKHDEELKIVLGRLESLTKANEEFMQQSQKENSKIIHMESEIMELRRLVRGVSSLNDGVDHLWKIKETEYGNVNQILRNMRVNPSYA